MRITKLHAANFCGSDFQHQLAPVTVFAGDNTRGKTTRLNALVFALAGHVPGVAKKPSDLFAELATGSTLLAAFETEDNSTLTRTLTQRRDAVKSNLEVVGLAPDFAVEPVLVDAREFLDLSERERVKFIFSRCRSAADLGSLHATLAANLKKLKVEGDQIQAEAVIAELVGEFANAVEDARRLDITVNELVDELWKDTKEQALLAAQNVKRMAATNAGVAQVARDEAPPSPDCEARLAAARKLMTELSTEVGRRLGEMQSAQKELEDNRALAASAGKEAELLAEVERLTDERDAFLRVSKPEPFDETKVEPDAETKFVMAELSARLLVLNTQAAAPEPDVNAASETLERDREERDRANARLGLSKRTHEDIAKELAATEAETCCSKCGQSIVKLREEVIARLKEALAKAEVNLIEDKAAATTASSIFDTSWKAFKVAADSRDLLAGIRRERGEVEAKLGTFKRNVIDDARRLWLREVDKFNAAQRDVTNRNTRIAQLRGQIESRLATEAAERVPALEAKWMAAKDAYADAVLKANDQSQVVAKIEGEVRKLATLRAENAQRARIEQEASLAGVRAEVLAKAVAMLEALKAELVASSVAPLLGLVNDVCRGILPFPVDYRDGRFGFVRGSSFVERTMCGAERALVYASLSLALAVQSPTKLLIVDEVGRLDRERKLAFLDRLLALVEAGMIHQAVLADTSAADYVTASQNPNFRVVKL